MDDAHHGGADRLPLAAAIAALSAAERRVLRAGFAADEWSPLLRDWAVTARPEQLPPPGDWRVWLIMAGRGFGKTRAGAEWVNALARRHPDARIALVGASHDDVRQVMVEGESGILACAAPRQRPAWHPALRRLVWPGGAIAAGYSAAEPEGLRGPQFHFAWADEVARWDAHGLPAGAGARSRGEAAWDTLAMAVRLGDAPRLLATTTPRALPIVRRLLALPGVAVTRGSTLDNQAHLAPGFIAAMRDAYGDTLLARQEIGGELIEDVPGALWTRGGIEAARIAAAALPEAALARVVIGVDPPAGRDGDACGIIVCAALAAAPDGPGNGAGFAVLADASVERAGPERWARAVAEAAARWGADRIVAEANNGGEMVRSVLLAEDAALPVALVHASRGKAARAEPVAHAYAPAAQHYLAGFVLKAEDRGQWAAIDAAADRGLARGVAATFIWALPQVARDGYVRFGPPPSLSQEDGVQSFDDVDFPLSVGREASVLAEFSTAIVTGQSGAEQRAPDWDNARLRYDAGPGLRSEQDVRTLIDFYRARRGPAIAFRFRDPLDSSSAADDADPGMGDQRIGSGDGVLTDFPLLKRYGDGAGAPERRITRPVPGSVLVSVDGVAASGWTLGAGGVVRFVVPPVAGAAVRAGFRFDVPVRFAEDRLTVSRATWLAGDIASVPLIEVREG